MGSEYYTPCNTSTAVTLLEHGCAKINFHNLPHTHMYYYGTSMISVKSHNCNVYCRYICICQILPKLQQAEDSRAGHEEVPRNPGSGKRPYSSQ